MNGSIVTNAKCQNIKFSNFSLKLIAFFSLVYRKWSTRFVIHTAAFCASWYSRRTAFRRWWSSTRSSRRRGHVITSTAATSTPPAARWKLITQRWETTIVDVDSWLRPATLKPQLIRSDGSLHFEVRTSIAGHSNLFHKTKEFSRLFRDVVD